jgi:hypothetical protein
VQELNKKETEILKKLNFKLHMPNLFNFNNVFVQIAINEFFSVKDDVNMSEESKIKQREDIIYHLNSLNTNAIKLSLLLLHINEDYLKFYSEFPESIFNSPLTSGLICFKATLTTLANNFNFDISFLQEKINILIFSTVKNLEYINKIDVEAFKVYSRVIQVEKYNNKLKEKAIKLLYSYSNS